MNVIVQTLDSTPMTSAAATVPLGKSLRIAAGFVASTLNDATGVETAIEARYTEAEGRYVITMIVNRGVRLNFNQDALRNTATSAILRAAVPFCMTVPFGPALDDPRLTVQDLTGATGRLIPEWMVDAAVARGAKDERYEIIEVIYGAAALAGMPPVRAVKDALGVPHRSASDWISKARRAGYLQGMTYAPGRQADID